MRPRNSNEGYITQAADRAAPPKQPHNSNRGLPHPQSAQHFGLAAAIIGLETHRINEDHLGHGPNELDRDSSGNSGILDHVVIVISRGEEFS